MQTILDGVKFISENYQVMINAVIGLLSGVIGIALLIPGPEPERTLQKVVDFLQSISKK